VACTSDTTSLWNQDLPFPSNRHHRSNGDCLEGKRENYQVCCVQYCVQQLYTVNCTHMNRTNSCLDWVLSLWAHFSVLRFIFVYVLFCVWLYCMHVYYCNMVRWTWWDWSLILRTITSFSAFWHCWLGHVKPVPDMTYNVFSGTLNPTQSIKVMESRTDRLHILYYWTVFSQHLDFLF